MLDAVELGVDLVEASFCHRCTTQGYALTLPVKPPAGTKGSKKRKRGDGKDGDGDGEGIVDEERVVGDEERVAEDGEGRGEDGRRRTRNRRLDRRRRVGASNMWALAYRADKRPLLPGCECYTCERYMRAYVHHLLQCHEMTAVLLDIHNYFHFNKFMEAAREAIGAGRRRVCRVSSRTGGADGRGRRDVAGVRGLSTSVGRLGGR